MDEVIIHSGDSSVEVDSFSDTVVIFAENGEVDVDSSSEEVDVSGSGYVNLDYNVLANKPSINEVVLKGNKTLGDIGLSRITNSKIRDIVERSS